MSDLGKRATLFNIFANSFLFAIKLAVGLMTGSIAILSDAANSFSDICYSIAIFFAVKVSNKAADAGHPFGHHRAEPVAGLLIALLAGILGFQVIKAGVDGLINGGAHLFSIAGVAVLLTTMCLKSIMWLYFKGVAKRMMSPALHATSIDCRNDVIISFTALLGFSSASFGIDLDEYAAILIGLFVIRSGYKIGIENIDYLMGRTAPTEVIGEIRKLASSIKGVTGTNDIRAHYVGNFIHVEVHIEVPKDLKISKAHDIGKQVQRLIEEMPSVDKAFVHIDPR